MGRARAPGYPKLRFIWGLAKYRPTIFAIGAALLVGGWGTTRYADFSSTRTSRTDTTRRFDVVVRTLTVRFTGGWGDTLYFRGVVMMALGAGLMGFAAFRRSGGGRA